MARADAGSRIENSSGLVRATTIDASLYRIDLAAVMLQMWLAFFIFICPPARPPRYFRAHLPSLLGFNDRLQATRDTHSPLLVRASFPSLHCAYGMLTLSLFVATLHLRHHWIPDCLAGMCLAVVVCQLAPWLRAHWPTTQPLDGAST